MRVIPTVSRLALSVVLAFGICAAPYSLALQGGRVEPVKQEAHAAAPLVAIPAIAAACGISEEAAIAGIGAIVAGVAGVSLFDIAQSRDVTVGDIAEDYVNRQAEMGYFDERALYEPPDPNNQNGNDPEGRSNKLKSVLIALATTTGASVAFSALDNLVDSVFDWATAAISDGGAGSVSGVYQELVNSSAPDITYRYGKPNWSNLGWIADNYSYPQFDILADAVNYRNFIPVQQPYNETTGLQAGAITLATPGFTLEALPSGSLKFSYYPGVCLSEVRSLGRNNYSFPYVLYNFTEYSGSGYQVWGGVSRNSVLFVIPSNTSPSGSYIGELSNVLTQLPEIIDDTVKQYGFASSSESQQTIINNYLNNYVNQPSTGDKVTVITIPTVDPGQATYPDYKTEVEPEKVTPVTPKPDTPDTPDEPMDFKGRVEKLLNLGFGAIFPFCLINDLAMLFNKLVAAPAAADAGTDFSQFTIPLSKFGVAGANDLTFDLTPLVDLAQQFRWSWVWLELAGLLYLSFKLFLNRGGE